MRHILLFITLIIYGVLSAQNGYDIKIKVENYPTGSLFASYNYGGGDVVLNALKRKDKGEFVLKSDAELPDAVYYIGTIREKKLFPFIITQKDNHFDLTLDFGDKKNYSSKGSKENKVFFEYKRQADIIENKRKEYLMNRQFQKKDLLTHELNQIRRKYVAQNPGTFVAKLIKSDIEWLDSEIINVKGKYRDEILDYKIKNYLNNIDLGDKTALRLPKTHKLITGYFDRVVHLKPDAVIPALDSVLGAMGYKSEMFKFYLPFFTRKYSFPFKPWVDKVYVHLAKKYYTIEIAHWLSDKEIQKVQEMAKQKEQSLPGNIIPDVTLADQNNKSVKLRDIDAKYLVLVFWRPGCSHCRHAMPILREFQNKYKSKGVKIVTACTRQRSNTYRCWEGVKSEKMEEFDYNLADKSGKTGFLKKYNIGGVPNIFIIDKNKKIIDKKVAPSKLEEVFEKVLRDKE